VVEACDRAEEGIKRLPRSPAPVPPKHELVQIPPEVLLAHAMQGAMNQRLRFEKARWIHAAEREPP